MNRVHSLLAARVKLTRVRKIGDGEAGGKQREGGVGDGRGLDGAGCEGGRGDDKGLQGGTKGGVAGKGCRHRGGAINTYAWVR